MRAVLFAITFTAMMILMNVDNVERTFQTVLLTAIFSTCIVWIMEEKSK